MTLKILGAALLAVIAALVVGAILFVRPDLPRTALIKQYADANSRFIKLPDGSDAHVEILGAPDKPVVVLLHGAMSSVQSWDAMWTPRLSTHYRVIAIDLPGSGLTGETGARDYSRSGMVAFTHQVLKALGVSLTVSWPGFLNRAAAWAAEYAERYPQEGLSADSGRFRRHPHPGRARDQFRKAGAQPDHPGAIALDHAEIVRGQRSSQNLWRSVETHRLPRGPDRHDRTLSRRPTRPDRSLPGQGATMRRSKPDCPR